MMIKLKIKYRTENLELSINTNDTLKTLRNILCKTTGINEDVQVISFKDRILTEDNKKLHELGVENDSILHLKKRVRIKGEEKKPDFTASMMKNPLVKNFLKNPDAMKNIVDMFPGLKEEMENNSELRGLMNNSNLQEELEMFSSNPEYMSTQLKNLDITMSKLENMPGGLNMINSMIKDVRDPLSSALLDGMRGGCNIKTGRKIEEPINEAIPGPGLQAKESNLVKYRSELADLKQMGFRDTKQNLDALIACNGDLESCIIYLGEKNVKSFQK